jgi:hypothetical protein
MKDSKIQKLFASARKETPPEAPFNFSQNVLAEIRRGERQSASTFVLFDELGRLFPRLACAALLIISVCIAADFYFTKSQSTLAASVEQAADEWMFAAK